MVISKRDTNDNIAIQYPKDEQGHAGIRGYVAVEVLEIGYVRRIGEALSIEIGQPYRPHLAQSINPTGGGLLYNTIFGLLSSYHEHREDLPTIPVYLGRELGTEARVENFARRIITGVEKVSWQLAHVLDDGNFSITDIRKWSWRADGSKKTGIYIILYSDYPGAPLRMDIYVGSTGQTFEGRYARHVAERKKQRPKEFITAPQPKQECIRSFRCASSRNLRTTLRT